jgi:hypothetical protein
MLAKTSHRAFVSHLFKKLDLSHQAFGSFDPVYFGCWGSMERKVALRNQRFCKLLRIRRTQFCQLELVRGDFRGHLKKGKFMYASAPGDRQGVAGESPVQ